MYIDGELSVSETFYNSTNLKRKRVYNNKIISSVHDYYDSGQLKNEVIYTGSKEKLEIKAKSYFENGLLKRDDEYVETIEEGEKEYKLIKGLCLSEDGSEISHTPFMRFPQFPGGNNILKLFISKNLKYPKDTQKKKIEGRVFVSFVVNKTGEIEKVRLVKSVNYSLDKEALRVVSHMPNWTPGIECGEIANFSFTLPINFRLR